MIGGKKEIQAKKDFDKKKNKLSPTDKKMQPIKVKHFEFKPAAHKLAKDSTLEKVES